jgi:myo-inositol-1(or 4)-monophosphatase
MTDFQDSLGALDGLRRPLTDDEGRWLLCAKNMAQAGGQAVRPLLGGWAGREILGRGAGGDRTMEIDRAPEAAIQEVLAAEAPFPYTLVSEESGISGTADADWRVVVDPLDGSLNAKRGLEPFCAAIAMADGKTLADVRVAYIEDYVRGHGFAAVKGAGLPGVALDQRRFEEHLVEIVLMEAGRPDRHHFTYDELSSMGAVKRSRDMRIRQIGSLALSLCYVAVGVADILVAAVRSRSVDIAAGLLILAEAGGGACTLDGADLWAQELDLERRCPFVAWRAGLDGSEIAARARKLSDRLMPRVDKLPL